MKIDGQDHGVILYTYREAAAILKISTAHLRRLTSAGSVPHIKFSARCIRFTQENIAEFIQNRRQERWA